jgi:putative DNA primase/helicase
VNENVRPDEFVAEQSEEERKAEAAAKAAELKAKEQKRVEESRKREGAKHPPIALLQQLANPTDPYPKKSPLVGKPIPTEPLEAEAAYKANGKAKNQKKDEGPKAEAKIPVDLSLKQKPFNKEGIKFEKTIVALTQMGIQFSYDLFCKRYRVEDHVIKERFGESIDNAILVLRTTIMDRFRFDPGQCTAQAVFRLCLEHAYNPILDYLDKLQWDGKPRLNNWLSLYLGAVPGPLNSQFGRKLLVAAVRRVRNPGIKFDQMLVLEGPQNVGKSSAVKILAGDNYFRDAPILAKGDREIQEQTAGCWLYEISELLGLDKKAVEHIKQFLSRTHDPARPAYGRVLEDQPRTCIFIGTTNQSDYLSDDSGNRRFWPVAVGNINLEALKHNRDQLWAEANVAEAAGETLVIDPELWNAAAALTEERRTSDPWETILAAVETMVDVPGSIGTVDGEKRVASDYLLSGVLNIDPAQQHISRERRVAAIMRRLGWIKPGALRVPGGVRATKGYAKKIGSV